MTPFHVTATGHSLNYLTEYIATRHGFFKEQELEVTVSVPRPWDLVLDQLADGTANAALGGIWVPSMYRNTVKEYTAFAQVANRSPLALVKRGHTEDFQLSDVPGKTVLIKSGNGASVGLFFKMLLKENDIDPKSATYIQDLDGVVLGKLFQGGMGDYFLTDNVTARAMVEKNSNLSIAIEMAKDGGDIPWSVYYCATAAITPDVLDAHKRFCIALGKGIEWVLQHDAETFKDELAELFPAVPTNVLVDLTNSYRQNGMWSSPSVSRHGYKRWQHGIAYGGLIKEPFPYEVIVNNGPALAAASVHAEI